MNFLSIKRFLNRSYYYYYFKLQTLQRGNQASYLSLHFLWEIHIASKLDIQT